MTKTRQQTTSKNTTTSLSLEYSFELKLKDINMALEKIEKGTYGICEKCGKKIDEERLVACPEAKTCLKCNSK